MFRFLDLSFLSLSHPLMFFLLSLFSAVQDTAKVPNDTKPAVTKSGRKLKGRGTMVMNSHVKHFCVEHTTEEVGKNEEFALLSFY